MKVTIIYGDEFKLLTADELQTLKLHDTYNSGDKTYAIDSEHDGILDSDHGELHPSMRDQLLAILAGNSSITSNGKSYSDGIVAIPGGQFEMGSLSGSPNEHKSDGTTVRVTMTGFRLSKSEVTLGQYKAYIAADRDPDYFLPPMPLPDHVPQNQEGDRFPVVALHYGDMVDFCKYYGGTLPTAAQIEYASKGPNHTDAYGTPFDRANIHRNTDGSTMEVCGTHNERSNGYGACDLFGNVWETTSDQYDASFYDRMPTKDPSNPFKKSAGQSFEIRGAAFLSEDRHARSTIRVGLTDDDPLHIVGFRCAWPLP